MNPNTKTLIALSCAGFLCANAFSMNVRPSSQFTEADIKSNESYCYKTERCGWYKIDDKTLGFTGFIVRDKTYKEFMAIASTMHVEKLVVNSPGGDGFDAMEIGAEIQKRNLAVNVEGYCASGCANYFLLVAKKISINGLVGFHAPRIGSKFSSWYLDWINKFYTTYMFEKKQSDLYRGNEKLIQFVSVKVVGVDKGAGDGLYRGVYVPSKEELEKLTGVTIQGNQRRDYVCYLYEVFKESGNRNNLTYSTSYGTSENYCKN